MRQHNYAREEEIGNVNSNGEHNKPTLFCHTFANANAIQVFWLTSMMFPAFEISRISVIMRCALLFWESAEFDYGMPCRILCIVCGYVHTFA